MAITTIETPTWANPLWHRGYKVFAASNGQPPLSFVFVHDDFDGAPDANDYRNGWARTLQGAKDQIDEIEDDAQ
jgi:hypothetical protein